MLPKSLIEDLRDYLSTDPLATTATPRTDALEFRSICTSPRGYYGDMIDLSRKFERMLAAIVNAPAFSNEQQDEIAVARIWVQS